MKNKKIYLSNSPDPELKYLCDDSNDEHRYPFWNESMQEYYDKIKLVENETSTYTKKLNNNHNKRPGPFEPLKK